MGNRKQGRETEGMKGSGDRRLVMQSRSRCEGRAQAPGSTIDKTDEILNDTGILFVSSHIYKRLF